MRAASTGPRGRSPVAAESGRRSIMVGLHLLLCLADAEIRTGAAGKKHEVAGILSRSGLVGKGSISSCEIATALQTIREPVHGNYTADRNGYSGLTDWGPSSRISVTMRLLYAADGRVLPVSRRSHSHANAKPSPHFLRRRARAWLHRSSRAGGVAFAQCQLAVHLTREGFHPKADVPVGTEIWRVGGGVATRGLCQFS